MNPNLPSTPGDNLNRGETDGVVAVKRQPTEKLPQGGMETAVPSVRKIDPALLEAAEGTEPEVDCGERFPGKRGIHDAQRIVTGPPISRDVGCEAVWVKQCREFFVVVFYILDKAGWLSRLVEKVRKGLKKGVF